MKDWQRYVEVFDKHVLFTRPWSEGGDRLYVCMGCGCLVIHQEIHNVWHKGVGVEVVLKEG